jgi:hypothetical protein
MHWARAEAHYPAGRYDEMLNTPLFAMEESIGKALQIELLVAQPLMAVGRYADEGRRCENF